MSSSGKLAEGFSGLVFPSTVDVVDRAGRLVGHVTIDNFPATVDVSDRAARLVGHVTVDNFPAQPQAVTESGQWDMAPDPASVVAGRTRVTGRQNSTTGNVTLYTVTAGKVLYVTWYQLSVISAGVAGDIRVRDSSTVVHPYVIAAQAIGQNTQHEVFGGPMGAEPAQFATDFNVFVAAGTLTWACAFIGYEK